MAAAQTMKVPLQKAERDLEPCAVAVTGATGYVAGHIVQRLLAAGHTVHATCRNPDNGKSVAHLKSLPGANERLKLFKADLMEDGSFVEAFQKCKYVMHTASPYVVYVRSGTEEELLIKPALHGTKNVLDAVNEVKTIERVILTSSVAAIVGDPTERGEDYVFTEDDWSIAGSTTTLPYFCSKRLAEKKAREMCMAQKRWDLVSINPGQIFGPPLSGRADGESVSIMKGLVGGLMWIGCPNMGMGVVDVRDVAAAHCLAMAKKEAAGRYILVSDSFYMKEMAEMLAPIYPNAYLPMMSVPKWLMRIAGPFVGYPSDMIKHLYGKIPRFHNNRAKSLGIKFLDHVESMSDMLQTMADRGILSKTIVKHAS